MGNFVGPQCVLPRNFSKRFNSQSRFCTLMFLLNSVHLQGIKLASSAEDLLDKLGTKIMVSPKTRALLFWVSKLLMPTPTFILNRLLSCQLLENKAIKWKEIHILPSEKNWNIEHLFVTWRSSICTCVFRKFRNNLCWSGELRKRIWTRTIRQQM